MFLSVAGLIAFLSICKPVFTIWGLECSTFPASSKRGLFLYSTDSGSTWRESNGITPIYGYLVKVVCDNGEGDVAQCSSSSSTYTRVKNYDCCMPVSCGNGGSCYRGLCQCPPTWTGTSCETRMSLKKILFIFNKNLCFY